jgi:hypothetical protein
MPDNPVEILVVADAVGDMRAQWEQLGRAVTITQTMPPRLALVQASGGRDALPSLPGLSYMERPDDPDAPTELTAEERMFVDAWRLRRQPKQRQGNGLAWDSPGFEPPDLPPS